MLVEEALIKAAACLLTGTIGVFVLATSRRRAANVFLAAFMFLLAGNQFAETMRALDATAASQLFWFRIASVFAFLDPLALYYFGSVYPERNRLNSPIRVGAVLAFCTGLAFSVGVLDLPWGGTSSTIVLSVWAIGVVAIYGAVLCEALRQVRSDPGGSAYAQLVPALSVITLPAIARSLLPVIHLVPLDPAFMAPASLWHFLGSGLVIAATVAILRQARSIPASAASARRLVRGGAWAGLAFAVVSKPPIFLNPLAVVGPDLSAFIPRYLPGAGDALKLFTFGVLASAAVLRNRMLDLSLRGRRWAARVLAGALVVAGLAVLGFVGSRLTGTDAVLSQPGILAALVIVLLFTQGFRRVVDVVAEKAYGVPHGSQRQDRIDAYRAAVEQAVEEGRVLGSDPRLRRLREELDLDDRTAHVLERMAGSTTTGGPLQPGEAIEGRYRIEAFVGRGSSGRIFRAHDELLERDVAIKELLHGGPHESARALEEARMAGRLEHPNIVTLHDVVTRPGASLLVTELVDGPTLAERVEEKGPLSVDELYDVVDGILSGLEAVHAQDVVHGDLKPANVLLAEGGVPKIADFGTSRVADGGTRHATADGRPPEGTPGYMAPEQRTGEPPTTASDLYAVAVMTDEIAEQPLPDPIDRVLSIARANDPGERYASATEMREALREAQQASLTSGR